MMNRTIRQSLLLLSLLLSPTVSSADNWWVEYYGGMNGDSFTDGLILDDGYIGFGTTSSFTSSPDQTHGAYVVRIDRNGILLWQKNISKLDNVIPSRIFRQAEGGFIAVGAGFDNASKQPGDIWLATFDDDGKDIRETLIRGVERFALTAVARLDDGSFVAGGSRRSIRNNDPDTLALVRFTEEGTLLWQRLVPNGADLLLRSLIRTSDGNLVASGSRRPKYRDSLLADSYIFAIRLTVDGDLVGDSRYHDLATIDCMGAAELPDGGLVLVGDRGRYDTATGTIVDYKGLLITLDRNGMEWGEPMIDSLFTVCNDVTVDDRGTVLVTGTGADTVEKIIVPRTVPAIGRYEYISNLALVEHRTFAEMNVVSATPTRILAMFDRIAVFGRTNLNGFLFSMTASATLPVEEVWEGTLDLR